MCEEWRASSRMQWMERGDPGKGPTTIVVALGGSAMHEENSVHRKGRQKQCAGLLNVVGEQKRCLQSYMRVIVVLAWECALWINLRKDEQGKGAAIWWQGGRGEAAISCGDVRVHTRIQLYPPPA